MSGGALVPVGAGALVIPAGGVRGLEVTPTPLAALVPRYLHFLQFVRERSENTIDSYAFDLRRFLEFCDKVGLERPDQVRRQLVEAYLAWLRHEKHLGVSTTNRHRACLKGFFGYLVYEEILAANPVTLTIGLKQPLRLPKRLTFREREHVLASLAEDESPIGRRDLAVVGLGCLAGLRCEELVTLRMEELDLANGILRVIGKGDKQREIPLVTRLRAILERYLPVRAALLGGPLGEVYRRTPSSVWRISYPGKDGIYTHVNTYTYSRRKAAARLRELAPTVPESPYVIVNANPRHGHALRRGGKPLLTRSIFTLVRRRVSPLVGRPVSPHTLRHTFASVLTERGASAFAVQRALGHENLATTGIYVHLSDESLRAEIEAHIG
jgi:site-specific recombinase XerD